MFVLIKNKITGEYHTIYKKDISNFKSLDKFFNSSEFNFDIIEDNAEIKKILDEQFTSKGRGEEYNEDLPSVTKIAYNLFPLNINTEKFLIRFWNDTPLKEQEGDKQNILSRGTFLHFILEQFVCDKNERSKDKPLIEQLKILQKNKKPSKKIDKEIDSRIISNIRTYIQKAYKDDEILKKIPNIEDLKEELEYLAVKCLPNFIKNELIFTDLVYSEIFLCIDNYIQGSIDLTCYKDGIFSIVDFKTTSSLDKTTGKPKFKSPSQLQGYARQLFIYNELLKKSGMTHLYDDSSPDFYIYQIHLVSGKYKKFKIPQALVEAQRKTINNIMDWYWGIRNENYIEPSLEDELDDLGYLII